MPVHPQLRRALLSGSGGVFSAENYGPVTKPKQPKYHVQATKSLDAESREESQAIRA